MREVPSYIVFADFPVFFFADLSVLFCMHVYCGLLTVVYTFALAVNKNVGMSCADPDRGLDPTPHEK